jgi:hypothetical protein
MRSTGVPSVADVLRAFTDAASLRRITGDVISISG